MEKRADEGDADGGGRWGRGSFAMGFVLLCARKRTKPLGWGVFSRCYDRAYGDADESCVFLSAVR